MSSRRPRHLGAPAFWLLALLLALALHLAATAARAAASDEERLRRENEDLKLLVELASEKDFYLVLDTRTQALKLLYQGVTLREIPVGHVAVGRPRVLFVPRPLPHDWKASIWERGTLEPLRVIPRRTIIPPHPDSVDVEEEVEIPPTPEELVPAPPRWAIRYDEGRVMEIVGEGAKRRFGERVSAALQALGRAVWPFGADRVRLRVILAAEDAAMLYRSLPDTTRFKLL
jgi:hypothetical protein